MIRRGLFITLEGGEGAGKSTSLAFIEAWLHQAGRRVLVTREPGGTEASEHIRNLLLHVRSLEVSAETEMLLMFAARAEHIARVILPALSRGEVVICDRFTDATYAYQGGGRGVAESRIAEIEQWVQGDLRPDLTLLFDVPVELGLTRAGTRSEPDRFESESRAFFERVRAAYLARASREPRRMRVIDAARPVEAVQQALGEILNEVVHGARAGS